MKKLILIINCFIFVCMLISTNIKAQLPVNDISWHLDTSLSDEFNESSINVAKWDTTYNYWYNKYWQNNQWWYVGNQYSNVNNGAEWDFGRNLIMTDTTLKIKADTLNPNRHQAWGTFPNYKYGGTLSPLTYAYQGGVIISKNPSYKFGYVEMYAKFPSHKWPLWLCGWLWSADCNAPKYYNEIDFAENGADISYNGYQVGNNFHVADTSCQWIDGLNGSNTVDVLAHTDSLSGGFHKFAVQWEPHRFTYYFDDVPTTTVYDASGVSIPQNAMSLILNFCVWPWFTYLPADWTRVTHQNTDTLLIQWPQYFEIDYVRYYKLDTACSRNLTIYNPSDYDRKVEKTITTSNVTYSSTQTSNSYTLRATDSVTLGAGTYINPNGTGYFAIETMGCPQ